MTNNMRKAYGLVVDYSKFPLTFEQYCAGEPFGLVSRFERSFQHLFVGHVVPTLDALDPALAFSTYGVVTADSWAHIPKSMRSVTACPVLLDWKTLLGLTSHGLPFLVELVERRHLELAALVWRTASRAMKQFSVATHELFYRALQHQYSRLIDPYLDRPEVRSFPLHQEEIPVLGHYYQKQLETPEYLVAVRETFDATFEAVKSDVSHNSEYYSTLYDLKSPVSVLNLGDITRATKLVPKSFSYPVFPSPPFGPFRPGMFLHELLYANNFRYRPGGVIALEVPDEFQPKNGEPLPSALVINFNHFIPYRTHNLTVYNKIKGKMSFTVHDMAVCAVETFGKHYYNVLADARCGAYYDILTHMPNPFTAEELMTTFVMPLPVLKDIKERAAKYSVNYLVGIPKVPRISRSCASRKPISAKSILTITSPDTPYLYASSFSFTHRRGVLLVCPPWPVTLEEVRTIVGEKQLSQVGEHAGQVFVSLRVLRQLESTQKIMTEELSAWLNEFDRLNKYSFKAEVKRMHGGTLNHRVRDQYGAKHLRFLPEEDEIILRLYRPGISREVRQQILDVCYGRSMKSISMRATILRNELMAKGIYDLTQLPHGARTESILKEIRDAKKRRVV
jgi:hypothetical protein